MEPLSLHRRTFLQLGALSTFSLLAPWRAWAEEPVDAKKPEAAKPGAIIVLWLAGGPSQLETFDPKPGT
ncbi:MAG: DUF1501 domain-containing protein, partial [Planctomycetota bacterium]